MNTIIACITKCWKACSPLSCKNVLLAVFVGYVWLQFLVPSKAIYALTMLLGLLPFTMWQGWQVRKQIWEVVSGDRLPGLVALFLAYIAIYALFTLDNSLQTIGTVRDVAMTACFIGLMYALAVSGPLWWRLFGMGFIIIAAVSATIALVYYGLYAEFGMRLEGAGEADHPNLGGGLYAMAALWAWQRFLESGKYKHFYFVPILPLSLAVLLTISKSAWLGYGLGLVLLAVFYRCYWLIALCSVAIVCGVVLAAILFTPLFPELSQHLSTWPILSDLVSRGASFRVGIWEDAWAGIQGAPVWGLGLRASFPAFAHPHNVWLSAWYYTGLPALLLLIGITISYVARMWRIPLPERTLIASWAIMALPLLITDAALLVDSTSEWWALFWMPVIYQTALLHRTKHANHLSS